MLRRHVQTGADHVGRGIEKLIAATGNVTRRIVTFALRKALMRDHDFSGFHRDHVYGVDTKVQDIAPTSLRARVGAKRCYRTDSGVGAGGPEGLRRSTLCGALTCRCLDARSIRQAAGAGKRDETQQRSGAGGSIAPVGFTWAVAIGLGGHSARPIVPTTSARGGASTLAARGANALGRPALGRAQTRLRHDAGPIRQATGAGQWDQAKGTVASGSIALIVVTGPAAIGLGRYDARSIAPAAGSGGRGGKTNVFDLLELLELGAGAGRPHSQRPHQ